MNKKANKEYTTIQIRKDINLIIRDLCKHHGWSASQMTEEFWVGLISSSLSGSFLISENQNVRTT
jgi:hypothetical protein